MGEVPSQRAGLRAHRLAAPVAILATALAAQCGVAAADQPQPPPGQVKKAAFRVAAGTAPAPKSGHGRARHNKKAAPAKSAPATSAPAKSAPAKSAKKPAPPTSNAAHPLPPTSNAPAVSAVHAPAAAPAATFRTASALRTSGGRHRAAVRHVRAHRAHARAHHRAASAGTPAAGLASGTAQPAAASAPAGRARPAARHPRASHPAAPTPNRRPSGGTPIVTPVFRELSDVVDVIPLAVWLALAGLGGLALLLALVSALQSRRIARLSRQRRALREDIDVLQAAVLPAVPASVGALEVSVAHRAAAGPAAGGDFHDVVALGDGRVALVVGDVAGHGRDAVGKAALVRFTLRAHLERGADAREALEIAASSLEDHFGEDGFATVAVAVHDPAAGTLSYSTAAHDAPIVLGSGAHEPVLASAGTPLGVGGKPARRRTVVPFGEGSIACLLTDGAFEARTPDGLVGRDVIAAWLEELGQDATAGALVDVVTERAAVGDDLAVCLARGRAGADSGRWRVEELHLPGGDAARGEAAHFLEACGMSGAALERTAAAVGSAHGPIVVRVRLEDGAAPEATVAADERLVAVAAA